MKDVIIHIPHIRYRVKVQDKKKGDRDSANAYTKRVSTDESIISIRLPITGPKRAGDLVHEIVHVLQNICEGSSMEFLFEREHMAYIAGYLFDEISKL